jgi:hypothetical protein
MILKMVTSRDQFGTPARTLYIDRLASVSNNGIVTDSNGETGTRLFDNSHDLRPVIAKRWGGDVTESFGETGVYWPELPNPGEGGVTITEIFAERDDRKCILVLACDDVFLMSDNGATVDRLK